MPKALDLLSRGAALIHQQFGAVNCTVEGLGSVDAHWNDLGRTEELTLHGRRINFSVIVEFSRSAFPAADTARLVALAGCLVTRNDTGQTFRIVGEVAVDELTVRFPLDSRHK